jgi:cobaltochelatase CobT
MLSSLWSKFARLAAPSPAPKKYRVFTTRFDLEVRGERLSEVIGRQESSAFGDYVSHLERALAQWRAVAEPAVTEFVDRVKAGSGGPEPGNTIACLLIDHSGSMRNQPSIIATTLATIVAECWSRLGISHEILGFTTRSWHGGRPRRHWILAGQPAYPGRLCELLHIVYRSADDTCAGAPQSIRNMMREELLKENVDGEAVMWAAERLRRRPEKRKVLLVVSDGAPVDDATLAANNGDILHRHLKEIIAAIRRASDIRLGAVGLGHDVSLYYPEGIVIISTDELTGRLLPFLAGLFEDRPLLRWPQRSIP